MSILESIVMGILLHFNVVAQRKTAMVTVRSSDIDGKCRQLYHAWILWVGMTFSIFRFNFGGLNPF